MVPAGLAKVGTRDSGVGTLSVERGSNHAVAAADGGPLSRLNGIEEDDRV